MIMKLIITEDKLKKVKEFMYDYIYKLFEENDRGELSHTFGPDPDDYLNDENENYFIFYFGDYDDNDTAFEWTDKNSCEGKCPKIFLDNKLKSELDITFGEGFWHDSFKSYLMKHYDKTFNSIANLFGESENYQIPDDDDEFDDDNVDAWV